MSKAFNREMTICECERADQKVYKKSRIEWKTWANKLATPLRTQERQEVFFKLDGDSQTKIKESNGGFFLGDLKDNRRLKGNVLSRCALVLDLDNLSDLDEAIELLTSNYSGQMVIYSTHKHTKEKPRYRVIIPLLTDIIEPGIYEAVSRMFIATYGDIEWCDDSTHEPNRMMFYPTVSQDAEYFYLFANEDGDALDWQEMLNLYSHGWGKNDWPLSSREIARQFKEHPSPRNGSHTVEDPRSKTGLVGTVCRAYGIREVLDTFFSDQYEPGSAPDRYQLIGANSSNGLWVASNYGGDALVYSHHSNKDILSNGHYYNSFDLVRELMFGYLDKDQKHLKGRNLPSFKEAENFFLNDAKVQRQMRADNFIPDKTGVTREEYLKQNFNWMDKLPKRDKYGHLAETTDNIKAVLENDIRLKGIGGIDRLKGQHIKTGDLPWEKLEKNNRGWKDSDFAGLYAYLETNYVFTSSKKMELALSLYIQQNSFDSAAQMFENLHGKWDGKPRFELLPHLVGGVDDTWYNRLFIRKWGLQVVYRAFNPGCKADYVLALTGPQGSGKTTFFETLIGDDELIGDLDTIEGVQALDQIQGKLLVTMDELKPTRVADVNRAKNFLSKRVDHYRKAYRRDAQDWPRHCVFCATTNDSQFLRDVTGNRRWLPLRWPGKHEWSLEDLAEQREQLWAEVVFWYDQGESWEFSPEEAEKIKPIQDSVREISPDEAIIQEYLEQKKLPGWFDLTPYEQKYFIEKGHKDFPKEILVDQTITSCLEIYCVVYNGNKNDKDKSKTIQMINRCLTALGWTSAGIQISTKSYGRVSVQIKNEMDTTRENINILKHSMSLDGFFETHESTDNQNLLYLITRMQNDAEEQIIDYSTYPYNN